ncbi:MAG TPA: hypothetical protein VGR47_16470 [Terracidiphilus sp.]|nr:hypothetical protein [Terracidiphilus sp.]
MASDISTQDFILLAYKAFGGKMNGKTLLQKRVYFLSVMVGEDLGYGAHYYGPYSSEVATGNAELKSLGFLKETVALYGTDDRGFERARYEYELSDFGNRVADQVVSFYSDLWMKIHSAAKSLTVGGNLDYMALSIAAKAYYILQKEGGRTTLEKIRDLLPKFGWSVSEAQLKSAAEFLKRAELVA